MTTIQKIEVTAEENFDRLDVFLAEELEFTRNRVQNLIKRGHIRSDGRKLKSSMNVQKGDKFLVDVQVSENAMYLRAEPVDFEVVYEDEYLLVINKPAGLVVHPSPGNWRNTLVNGLVYRYPELKLLTNWLRPGIVHRLDSGTSGLMVVARTQKMSKDLQKLFSDREVDKNYIALAHGKPKRLEGTISGPLDRDPDNFLKMAVVLGGKSSLTGYKVLWTKNNISMVKFKLFTGRTHQIRVHFSALGCPLVGDTVYGAPKEEAELGRVYLHSWRLSFVHPATNERMTFRQNIPECFIEYIKQAGIRS
ncbi:MAG: RluA family pseudouridine synthase [Synergistales bacterium]|nr:RluA family pseudouridine synthase [Synergistales bacterium]MDY6401748.1 RluA family pseudouridine synthase [Synergistales bacterium]MDY6404556.1 RluA family pseudouridine synthase [Synergistales bacterium]MDY6411182.1 RluA family pseudouridine synthase [Synergistales bacterium]MDY6413620.1 RluA family pseudouridine synthase [Synergistales bacterium]